MKSCDLQELKMAGKPNIVESCPKSWLESWVTIIGILDLINYIYETEISFDVLPWFSWVIVYVPL